jgi:hypothetical protein
MLRCYKKLPEPAINGAFIPAGGAHLGGVGIFNEILGICNYHLHCDVGMAHHKLYYGL